MKKLIITMAGILSLVALLAGGCAPAPTAAATGTVEVRVTDAPRSDNVTSIMVTVSEVKIHKATAEQKQEQPEGSGNQTQQQNEEQGGEWISIEITGTNPFDLLQIKGIEEVLGTENVTGGKYTQIRMTVDKVEVSLGENEPEEATLPSGELKFVRPFDVVEGQTTILLIDFDAEKSVTVAGAGKVIVKPVVRLAITPPASALSLEIASPEDGAELSESPVTVNGTVSNPEAAVTVSGAEVGVAEDGTFAYDFELAEGENAITVVATLDEQTASKTITVTYAPVD